MMAMLIALGACSEEVWVTLHNVSEESAAAEITAWIDGTPTPHSRQRLSPIQSRFVANVGNSGGQLSLQVDALDGAECVIGQGQAMVALTGSGRQDADIDLAAAPGCVLNVEVLGPGIGKVISAPAGIDCGDACDHRFMAGREPIRLTAVPDQNSYLSSWSGGCVGTEPVCELLVQRTSSVVATFGGAIPVVVEKSGDGDGTVVSDPPGIACAPSCSARFPEGARIRLSPQPTPTSVFAGWSGPCSGNGLCEIQLNQAAQVTARFLANAVSITLSGSSAAGGAVIAEPPGLSCSGNRCSGVYPTGTKLTLSPYGAPPACFNGWTGACTGTGPCVVSLNGPLDLSADFATCSWQSLSTGLTEGYYQVWGTQPNDVWLATTGPWVTHWDGNSFRQEGISRHSTLGLARSLALWGSGPNDVWTGGGNGGLIAHWDGTSWATCCDPIGSVSFYSMWGSGPTNIWAVGRDYGGGSGSAVAHGDGTAWSGPFPSSMSYELNSVWGSGPTDVWAVGVSGVYHRVGSGNSFVQVPGITMRAYGVWGSGASDVWVVGATGILHWDGLSWSTLNSSWSLTGVWGSSAHDVWAVGSSGTVHWNGSTWSLVSTTGGSVLWGSGPSNIWVVSGSYLSGGGILRYHP